MKYSRYIGGLILITALISGCQEDNAVAPSPSVPAVSYVKVSTGTYDINSKMQARVVASHSAEVRPQVTGIIQERLFEEGSFVEKGQVLYQIDPASFQAAYNEAKASLNSAKAALKSAQLKDQRYAKLIQFEGISQQDADDAHADYLEAKADIDMYQAALETAAINLQYTAIKASISGYIGISSVTDGALVTADQTTALATILTLDPIYVDMTKSSSELLALRQQMRKDKLKKGSTAVSLTLEDGTEYGQKGQMKVQEVSVTPSTGTVTLRAEFSNPDGLLLPGMFVRTQVTDAVDDNAILAPQQGIYHSADGTVYAYVIDKNNKIERRSVETLSAVGNQWVIANGLSVDDKLLVEGSDKVRPGSEVKPIQVSMDSDGSMVSIVESDAATSSQAGGA